MANKDNPIGAKPIDNIVASQYDGKMSKYYIPTSDTDDIWINDLVKLTGASNANGIPVIAKADPGDKSVGVVSAVKSVLDKDDYIYRKAGEERIIHVVDDPLVEVEMQVNGTITIADIGKQANIVVAAGNSATGISGTQLDLTTLTSLPTESAQIKILGILEKEGNEWGLYTHIRCLIADHEYNNLPTRVVADPINGWAYLNAAQSITSSGTWTVIGFDLLDPLSRGITLVDNALVMARTGIYNVYAAALWTHHAATTTRGIRLSIDSGGGFVAKEQEIKSVVAGAGSGTGDTTRLSPGYKYIAAGDEIKVEVFHDKGAALQLEAEQLNTYLKIIQVGYDTSL